MKTFEETLEDVQKAKLARQKNDFDTFNNALSIDIADLQVILDRFKANRDKYNLEFIYGSFFTLKDDINELSYLVSRMNRRNKWEIRSLSV